MDFQLPIVIFSCRRRPLSSIPASYDSVFSVLNANLANGLCYLSLILKSLCLVIITYFEIVIFRHYHLFLKLLYLVTDVSRVTVLTCDVNLFCIITLVQW